MLPMLLNTYGKLRQADKAWAIYQQLLNQQGQQSGDSRQQALHAREAQLPPDAATEPAGVDVAATAAQGGATLTAAGDDGAAAGGGAGGGAAWQARLAQRQARLAAEAERLVRELALGAFPLSDYAYSTIITALSRVRCGADVAIIAQCTMVQAHSFSKGRVAVRSQAGKGISLWTQQSSIGTWRVHGRDRQRDLACARPFGRLARLRARLQAGWHTTHRRRRRRHCAACNRRRRGCRRRAPRPLRIRSSARFRLLCPLRAGSQPARKTIAAPCCTQAPGIPP